MGTMKYPSKEEMKIYLKFCGWWELNNDEWFPIPLLFPPNPEPSEATGFYTILEAFKWQMKKDGQLDNLDQ
jgi:hypothetical protein